MFALMDQISIKVNKFIEYISAVFVLVMTSIVLIQITTRYIFNFSLPWAEEISKLFMVWFALLCAAVLVYEEKHVAITFIVERVNIRAQLIISLVFNILICLFTILLLYAGLVYTVDNINVILPASGITRLWLYIPLPIMAFVMIYHTIVLIIRTFKQYRGEIPYKKGEGEEEVT